MRRWRSGQCRGAGHESASRDRAHARPAVPQDRTDGFTLVELLITVTIIPLVMGAIGLALMGIFSLQGSASGRLTDSGGAQVISSTFLKDVQSAQMITTENSTSNPGSPQCGPGTQLLGLRWNGANSNYLDYVSYVTAPNSNPASYSLYRQFCSNGPSSTPTSTDTLATDISPASATAPPNVQCTTACSSSPTSGWVRALDVSNVTMNVTETLSHLTNSTQSFRFTLSASPRQIPGQGLTSAPAAKAPFTLLNKTSCDVLNIGNGTLSIDVGDTTGNGALGITSTCPSTINISNGGVLAAGSIITSDPSLNSVNPNCQTCSYPLNEYYSSQLGDPFTSLPAPTGVETGMTSGTCTTTTGTLGPVYNCSPGYYATDPGQTVFANGGTPTVNFKPGGNFWFKQGLTLPNNTIANFSTGIYIFDNLANPVTGSSFSTPPGITLNANNALFYVATGSMTFGNNISISMTGLDGTGGTTDYMGVTIWDASATDINNADGTMTHIDPLTLGNNGTSGYGYGGIYVPNGEVVDSENGTLTAAFIVCDSASFANGLNVNIKAQ